MNRKTRTYNTVGEMLDARRGRAVPNAVATLRAAGAFVKPTTVAANAGTRNPTNVGNPVPKGPSGKSGTIANAKRRAKAERKQAQRKVRGKRR